MKNKVIAIIGGVFPLLLWSNQLLAQTEAATGDTYFYDKLLSNLLIATAGIVLLGTIIAIMRLLSVMVKMQQLRIYQEQGIEAYVEEVKKPQESAWRRLYKSWTNVVPLEKEQDILFDHEYDGIRELDNSLPPWWVAMFYITIGFAVVYMVYYHFGGNGPSQAEEYEMAVAKAEASVEAYLSQQANLVDETNAELLTDEESLALGKTVFDANCAACHGMMGEGGVGPNMTDEYWIHGGGVQNVFKTIKYGVPEKGMISWQSQLRPTDMHRVASYIITLAGTNPPNAKEPQGVKYEASPQADTETDSGSQTEEEAEEGSSPVGMN